MYNSALMQFQNVCGLFGACLPWVPETFLARFPVSVKSSLLRRSWLRPTAEDVSAFGLRPTPKIPAASEKNLWYPG